MENLTGTVLKIRFRNHETGYSVLSVKADSRLYAECLVCHVPSIGEGDKIYAEGTWVTHKKYGPQFQASFVEIKPPDDEAGLIAFLTKMVKGIGETRAKAILKRFGSSTIDIMDNYPEKLKEVPGIGETRLQEIIKSWQAGREMRRVMIYLQKYGITPGYAVKIWKTYGEKTITVLHENPYKLADEVWGIGFKIADSIALKLGTLKDSPIRVKACILYTLNNSAEKEGHVFLYHDELLKKVCEFLEVSKIDIDPYLEVLRNENKVVIEPDDGKILLYHAHYHRTEIAIAENIRRLASGIKSKINIKVDDFINWYKSNKGIAFSDEQEQAIRSVCSTSGVLVITGLPGTGKTSVCKALLDLYDIAKLNYCVCAPTGKAAERLTEVTGRPARTIHRMLGFKGEFYEYNRNNQLSYDVVLVDEGSMVDVLLFNNLLDAIADGTRLVLIGDTAQLPSVGPGNVLEDVISSEQLPVVRLKKIFRQAEASPIILNAHRVNAGDSITFGGNFEFQSVEDPELPERLKTIVPELIRNFGDVQVLSPKNQGVSGVENINKVLQDTLNPLRKQKQIERGFLKLREHDKVQQIRNNYQKDIYNGCTGRIHQINEDLSVVQVDFDGRIVEYDFDELDELRLAYCMSIHKSQGSEFKCVVLCLTTSHYIMLRRKLLYTAITRAKENCIILGDKKAIFMAIKNSMVRSRNTKLSKRIQDSFSVPGGAVSYAI